MRLIDSVNLIQRNDTWRSGRIRFENGYAASVILHRGLYEVAVIGRNGSLDYTTPITRDVIRNLTADRADLALRLIANLPQK